MNRTVDILLAIPEVKLRSLQAHLSRVWNRCGFLLISSVVLNSVINLCLQLIPHSVHTPTLRFRYVHGPALVFKTAEAQERNLGHPDHKQRIKEQLAGGPAVAAAARSTRSLAELDPSSAEFMGGSKGSKRQDVDSATGVRRSSTPGLDRLISGKLRLPRPFRCVL